MILPHIVWTVINRGIELASCLKKRTAQQPSRSGEGQVHLSFGGSDESEKEREKERERSKTNLMGTAAAMAGRARCGRLAD
jgi:hypothetical protein